MIPNKTNFIQQYITVCEDECNMEDRKEHEDLACLQLIFPFLFIFAESCYTEGIMEPPQFLLGNMGWLLPPTARRRVFPYSIVGLS